MITEIELESGANRALVCYASNLDHYHFFDAVDAVLQDKLKGGDEMELELEPGTDSLEISLKFGDSVRRIAISVPEDCDNAVVGAYFYNEETPVVSVEELADAISEDAPPEPEPAPSISELISDSLRDMMLEEDEDVSIYGASVFVVPNDETVYELEVV